METQSPCDGAPVRRRPSYFRVGYSCSKCAQYTSVPVNTYNQNATWAQRVSEADDKALSWFVNHEEEESSIAW